MRSFQTADEFSSKSPWFVMEHYLRQTEFQQAFLTAVQVQAYLIGWYIQVHMIKV